jgi:hypothetical protein
MPSAATAVMLPSQAREPIARGHEVGVPELTGLANINLNVSVDGRAAQDYGTTYCVIPPAAFPTDRPDQRGSLQFISMVRHNAAYRPGWHVAARFAALQPFRGSFSRLKFHFYPACHLTHNR